MHKRNFGLDIVRSIAIISVLVAHIRIFFARYYNGNIDIFGLPGTYGVDLFFVLSGFLIGQIIIKDVIPNISIENIKHFYSRRWFRTLPIYYLLLFIRIIIDNFKVHQFNPHVSYWVFLQNFTQADGNLFPVSWSLCIEEWFYLSLPLMFLITLPAKYERKDILRIIGISVGLLLVVRTIFTLLLHPTYSYVAEFVPLRFDSLLIGVLLACLKIHYSNIYSKLCSKKVFIVSFSSLLFIELYHFSLLIMGEIEKSFFFTSIGFTIVSILMSVCIPFIENNEAIYKIQENKILFNFFTKTSLYSYSIYLIHLDVMTLISGSHHLYQAVLYSVLSIVITYIVSSFLYNHFEKPMMDLRDEKIEKKKFLLYCCRSIYESFIQKKMVLSSTKSIDIKPEKISEISLSASSKDY